MFFYEFDFNTLNLRQGEEVSYYFTVWDNDEVNGSKRTNSKSFFYKELSQKELLQKKELITKETKNSFSKSISITNELNKNIEEIKTSILQNKDLDWKEKQKINSLIEKQKKLENQINETK